MKEFGSDYHYIEPYLSNEKSLLDFFPDSIFFASGRQAIHHAKKIELFDNFMNIYNQTMSHNGADNCYYFERSFCESVHNDLHNNHEIFFALHEDKIIAMSIILYANNRMYYYLSGSLCEYRKPAPAN